MGSKKHTITSKLVLMILILVSVNMHAGTLEPGVSRIGYSYYNSSATQIWKGNEDKFNMGGDGNTRHVLHQVDFSRGYSSKFEYSAGFIYGKSEMEKGAMGGSIEGDTREHLTEIYIMARYTALDLGWYQLTPSVGVSTPGDHHSGSSFIALNDNTDHFSLGVDQEFNYNSFIFGVNFDATIRGDGLGTQFKENLSIGYLTETLWVFGAGVSNLETESGFNIGDSDWVAEDAPKPFESVKERKVGRFLFVSKSFMVNYDATFSFFETTDGRNTDVSKTYSLDLGYSF